MTRDRLEKIHLLLLIFGFTAPIGYLLGTGYYHGYLTAFHVSADAFPLSIQDTYFYVYVFFQVLLIDLKDIVHEFIGFLKTNELMALIFFFTLLLVFYSFFKLTSLMKWFSEKERTKQLVNKIKKIDFKKSDFLTATIGSVFVGYLLISILAILPGLYAIWSLVYIPSYSVAKNFAENARNEYLEKGCFFDEKPFSNCKELLDKNGKSIMKGLVVVQNTKHIAIFNKKGSFVIEIPPQAKIYSRINLVKEETLPN